MKVDAARLLRLLTDQGEGFALVWRDQDEFGLGRAGTSKGLYEQIVISGAGRTGEAVTCDAAISITLRQLGTKGMCELELVTDVATDQERGLAIVQTPAEVEDWERRVAAVAPGATRALGQRSGAALLARTEAARLAVEACLKGLPQPTDLRSLKHWLQSRAHPEVAKRASELAAAPGVLQRVGAEEVYEVACLALVLSSALKKDMALSLDPLKDRELMWRVQLMVDHLEALES